MFVIDHLSIGETLYLRWISSANPSLRFKLTRILANPLSFAWRKDMSSSKNYPKVFPIALKIDFIQKFGGNFESLTHTRISSTFSLWASNKGFHILNNFGIFPKLQFLSKTYSRVSPLVNLIMNHPLARVYTSNYWSGASFQVLVAHSLM